MKDLIRDSIPTEQLQRLSFLIGDLTGIQTLYPPDRQPIQYQVHFSGSREDCQRFLRFDFFGNIPGLGIETFEAMITYSETQEVYRMWAFAASQEEPVYLSGDFQDSKLVFVSEPTRMVWGMQRLRFSLEPLPDGGIELFGERWEPDGFAKYCTALLGPVEELSPEPR